MSQNTVAFTPVKSSHKKSQIQETNSFTPQQNRFAEFNSPKNEDNKIDYKIKTYKLMKQLTQSEVLNKKQQTKVRHLEQEIQSFKNQFQKFFNLLSVNNLDQMYRTISSLQDLDKQTGDDNKIEEWSGIIEEYKKIINTQQYKYIKIDQQLKIAEIKVKKYQNQRESILKQKDFAIKEQKQFQNKIASNQSQKQQLILQVSSKSKQIASLQEEVKALKKQYKVAILERNQSRQLLQELQAKYNAEIQHFEQMEKHVQQRLIEVERQMNYHRQERESHLQKIQLMRKQIQLSQNRHYFSFGGLNHVEIQTEDDNNQDNFYMNTQCLEISIKTLLQQNQRLKNTLLTLYCKKSNESLPQEVQLQLKILLNIKQNMTKLSKEEYRLNQQQSQRVIILKQMNQNLQQDQYDNQLQNNEVIQIQHLSAELQQSYKGQNSIRQKPQSYLSQNFNETIQNVQMSVDASRLQNNDDDEYKEPSFGYKQQTIRVQIQQIIQKHNKNQLIDNVVQHKKKDGQQENGQQN